MYSQFLEKVNLGIIFLKLLLIYYSFYEFIGTFKIRKYRFLVIFNGCYSILPTYSSASLISRITFVSHSDSA